MVERERPLVEVPSGSPWNLPAKPGEKGLDDAGFDFAAFSLVEQAGVDIDFDAFQRDTVPDDGSLIYVPQLSELEIRVLGRIKAGIGIAVADTAITDEAIENAGRGKIAELQLANIGDPLAQRLSGRASALVYGKRLQDCPTATLTAAFLLMGHEAFRTVGANTALSIPDSITEALKRLHDEIRKLPGSMAFLQMQRRGRISDKEALFDAARERGKMFFDTIVSVVDAIDESSLLEWAEMAPEGAERFKQMTAKQGILTPLRDHEENLREAIIAYAKHIEGERSHFGNVVEKHDGSYEVIGLRELQAAHDASDRFFRNDFLRSFFINLGNVYSLPGISTAAAFGMGMHGEHSQRSITLETIEAQSVFQGSITIQTLTLLRNMERYYAPKLIQLQQGTPERKVVLTRLGIARGLVIELLMINEFFMQTIERNNMVLQGLKARLGIEPETAITDSRTVSELHTNSHVALYLAALTHHAHKIALTLLQGVFG